MKTILSTILNSYYGRPWNEVIESPAINNVDYDDFRKIIYIMERMYESELVFNSIMHSGSDVIKGLYKNPMFKL
jgi:hypothetical protein